jgi:signal peptidase I
MVDKRAYRQAHPRRGDVIVYRDRSQTPRRFIGRVVGVPGDRVEFDRGRILVNGQPLDSEGTSAPFEAVLVPEDEGFLLGDNWSGSRDSRMTGTLPLRQVEGRVEVIHWSVDPDRRGAIRWDRLGRKVR